MGGLGAFSGLDDLGGLGCLGFTGGLGDLGAEMQKAGDAVCANFLNQCYIFGLLCILVSFSMSLRIFACFPAFVVLFLRANFLG